MNPFSGFLISEIHKKLSILVSIILNNWISQLIRLYHSKYSNPYTPCLSVFGCHLHGIWKTYSYSDVIWSDNTYYKTLMWYKNSWIQSQLLDPIYFLSLKVKLQVSFEGRQLVSKLPPLWASFTCFSLIGI